MRAGNAERIEKRNGTSAHANTMERMLTVEEKIRSLGINPRGEHQCKSAMGRNQRAQQLKNDDGNEGSALAHNQPRNQHNHRNSTGQSVSGWDIQQVCGDFPPGEASTVSQRRDNPRKRGQKRGKRIHPNDHAC